jgi:hypothetical protein
VGYSDDPERARGGARHDDRATTTLTRSRD